MGKIKIFIFGILTALAALVFENLIPIIFLKTAVEATSPFDVYLLTAILIEELLKLISIWKISRISENQKNIFWLAVFFGLGFAFVEIFLNILNFNLEFVLNYFGLFLIHTFTSTIYGLYFSKKESFSVLGGLAIFALGCFSHFLFNFSVFFDISPILTNSILAIFLLIMGKIGFLAKKKKLN
ncbi:MAG TPA: PrsW family glutamic-type intramembrane protease [Candidatus Moranbacteria bacterium]|nr:PrsW family glutamic-type intramembrane protease [Candidatus Moranbacteria bacterium]